MIYTIYPKFDATIYERTESKNAGLDQVLEISHQIVPSSSGTSSVDVGYSSRILMKFDVTELESYVNTGKISNNAKYYLSLRTVEATEIPQEYKIYAYPISSSWVNGTGKYYNNPNITDGVSWKYRSSKSVGKLWDVTPGTSSYEWDEISDTWVDANLLFGPNLSAQVTSSYSKVPGGGTWWIYDNVECTQSFSHETSDVYMDVTKIVKKWITGSGRFENDGMIIKFSEEIESSDETLPSLKFFSRDSNTIYVPKIHVVWNDSSFSTGSLSQVSLDNFSINVKLKKSYTESEKAKIRIYTNTRFPQKTYTTESYYTKNYFLPSSSYYEIRDAHTDEIILPFHTTGSKISCDGTSSYFNLWMDSFQPERFYRVVIKTETDNGDNVQIFDNNYYFKVSR